ncbi:hypothetical protein N7488_010631 [Penicillium malachiteum]|nr:hypothetical protein N7488_010631 [Penicillium malachiteum]
MFDWQSELNRNMLFGYDQGVMGGFLDSVPFQNTFPSISTTTGSSVLQGFTVTVYEIGYAFGALSVIFGGDRVGRRTTVIYGQAILIIGALIVGHIVSRAETVINSWDWKWHGSRRLANMERRM